MYNLNKLILIVAIFSIFTNLYGSRKPHITKEKIGQKYYLKRCSSCHGSGNRGGNLDSIQGWRSEFKDGAKLLIEDHKDEDNTANIINYLQSDDFQKEKKRLLKFLQEFAYDSETIPTCY